MNIIDIYEKYTIPPQLQLHQLRVAGVSKKICESIDNFQDTNNVTAAMLLHDMGNILKFDMTEPKQWMAEKGKAYWDNIKLEFTQKYGPDEHVATEFIAKELHVSDRIFELLSSVGFSQAIRNVSQDDIAKKICCYSDQRVSPNGVEKLRARIAEGHKRHQQNKNMLQSDPEKFQRAVTALEQLEKDIFVVSSLCPEDITDNLIADTTNSLKSFEL